MNIRRFLLACAATLPVACSTPADRSASSPEASKAPEAGSATTDASALPPMDTTAASAANAQSDTLKVVRTRHRFSAGTPDLFQLVLRGKSVLEGEVTFTITATDGSVIFRESLSAADLEAAMVYEMKKPTATPAEREAYVRRRMDEFFAEKNFRQPAIGPNETYQPGTVDRATWDELRRRRDAVGFQYRVGKEDGRRIAWSLLKKQAVRYGSFGG